MNIPNLELRSAFLIEFVICFIFTTFLCAMMDPRNEKNQGENFIEIFLHLEFQTFRQRCHKIWTFSWNLHFDCCKKIKFRENLDFYFNQQLGSV